MRAAAAAAALVLSLASPAAGSLAVTGWATRVPEGSGVDATIGWEFSLDTSVTVTALGVYQNAADGLHSGHVVGIFRDSDQALMGYESIPAGTSGYLEDRYQFLNLGTPFDLAPGSYTVAETITSILDPNNDTFFSLVTGLTTDPHVTFLTSARTYTAGFNYPTALGGFNDGYFGPNFIFTVDPAPPPADTPEPATTGLLGAGLAGLGVAARRRFTSTTGKPTPGIATTTVCRWLWLRRTR
jgi:hypothetical protein